MLISINGFLITEGTPFYLCFQQPQAFYVQQISIGRAAGARSSPAGFGKIIFLSFFSLVPFGRCVWRAYFFPKNLAPASRPTGAVLNKKPAELCRTDLKNKTKKATEPWTN